MTEKERWRRRKRRLDIRSKREKGRDGVKRGIEISIDRKRLEGRCIEYLRHIHGRRRKRMRKAWI